MTSSCVWCRFCDLFPRCSLRLLYVRRVFANQTKWPCKRCNISSPHWLYRLWPQASWTPYYASTWPPMRNFPRPSSSGCLETSLQYPAIDTEKRWRCRYCENQKSPWCQIYRPWCPGPGGIGGCRYDNKMASWRLSVFDVAHDNRDNLLQNTNGAISISSRGNESLRLYEVTMTTLSGQVSAR